MRKVWVETLNEQGEPQGRKYCFLCNFKVNLGEVVLCSTSRGLMLGRVIPFVMSYDVASAYIIGRVDLDAHLDVVREEERKQAALSQLKRQMEQRVDATDIYAIIAQSDPVMHGLLRQYRNLGGR